ncbi:MAG: hypothetical protein ACFFCZ_20180 [Promethearchaeota archaeon]
MVSEHILKLNAKMRLTEIRREAIKSLNEFNSLFNKRYGENRIITVKHNGHKKSTKQVVVIVK